MVEQEITELVQALDRYITDDALDVEEVKPEFEAAIDRLLERAVVGRGMKGWVRGKLFEEFSGADELGDIDEYFHSPIITAGVSTEDYAMFDPARQPDFERRWLEEAIKNYCLNVIANLARISFPGKVEEELSWANALQLMAILLNPGERKFVKANNEDYFSQVDRGMFEWEIPLLQNWVRDFDQRTLDHRFGSALPVLQTLRERLV